MSEHSEKSPYSIEIMNPQRNIPPPFDFERLTRFMSFGFIMSPLQFKWFSFLSRAFPITKQSAAVPALKRVAFDQLIWAPIGTNATFYFDGVHADAARLGYVFHLHDHRRGRRSTSLEPEIPRRLFAIPESQLHGLAGRPNFELSSHTAAVPNCIIIFHSKCILATKTAIANMRSSHLYPPLESLGRPTSH